MPCIGLKQAMITEERAQYVAETCKSHGSVILYKRSVDSVPSEKYVGFYL